MRPFTLILCYVALATSLVEAQQSAQTVQTPTSSAASKMTNDEVVKLIAAGLSEQVVITAVRQAPNREFDLSPSGLLALKAANVPDAVIVAMQAAPGPVNTKPTTTEGAQSAAQSAVTPKKHSGFYYRNGKFGDYILLAEENGTFQMVDAGTRASGTYTVDGSIITFTPSAKPARKNLLSNPPGTNRIQAGRITEPGGTFWEDLPPATTATTRPPVASAPPVPSDGCSGIELMGLFTTDMRPVSPLIIYLAKIRNGTNLTRIVTIEWLNMYGQAMESTNQVGVGQIVTTQLGANSPSDRRPINLRLTSCR